MNSFVIAAVLGVVEGLTEFLPVSSTGHLIIAGHLLGFVGDKADSFEVAIQLGAILSVVWLYWRRFVGLVPGTAQFTLTAESSLNGWPGLWRIALATLPALAVGYVARHSIKAQLFNPEAVTLALAVGGVAILLVERLAERRRANELDSGDFNAGFGRGAISNPRAMARHFAGGGNHRRRHDSRTRAQGGGGVLISDRRPGIVRGVRLRAA